MAPKPKKDILDTSSDEQNEATALHDDAHMVEKVKLECYKCSFISYCHWDIIYSTPIYGRQRSTDSLSHHDSRSRTTGKRLRIAGMIPDTVTCRDNAKDT